MVFLYAHGVGTSRAVRIYKTYGADAIALREGEPVPPGPRHPRHRVRDRRRAGAQARHREDRAIRARAGIAYALMQALDEGQCGLPREELIVLGAEAARRAGRHRRSGARGRARRGHRRARMPTDGRDCVFLAWLHTIERQLAGAIARSRRARRRGRPSTPRKRSTWVEQRLELDLADRQREAVGLAVASKIARHHRRPRRRQDHDPAGDPRDPGREARERVALRADGPGGEAPGRSHRPRGEDDSPPARGEPRRRPLPPRAVEPARLRPARRRRDVDGRRAADARAGPRRA